MWEYCTKEDVSDYCGVATTKMKDVWSEMVESMINEHTGEIYGGTQSYTETYDGDGTDTLVLNHKPITAVASLSLDDIEISSSGYVVYTPGYIRLSSNRGSPIAEAIGGIGVFPVGQGNIEVTYTAENSLVPGYVKLAAILMISEMALTKERGGADGSLSIARATQAGGEGRPWPRSTDISGKLRTIMKNTIGTKWRYR